MGEPLETKEVPNVAIGKLMARCWSGGKWDAGIEGFFAGLKHCVETGRRPPGKE